MSEYSKEPLHKTKRSAKTAAKRLKKAGAHVRVAAVTRYKLIRTK